MSEKAGKFGLFFKRKYGKDPRDLTLKEINNIAIGKKGKGFRTIRHVITARGSVFRAKFYNIEELFNKAIEK